ncbi:MAG TPA: RNA polymerase sigma factor [Candidatus Limnocylindrales bacterium]|nr:RNA polymerase sigma factor [Candidatus Limnocylindrales bacterium]
MGRSGMSGTGGPPAAWRPPILDDALSTSQRSTTSDDRAIVDAVLGGDREAYRRLVEREAPGLIRACHRILGDHAEAEDAAQEAFVTAFRSLSTWRGDGPLGAWLARIAVRIALRQAGRRRTVAWRDPFATSGASDGPTAADRAAERDALAAAPLTDPAILSLRAERATEIRTAVAALPEPYREVVALRFFGEASLDEIARETGRPLGTVKTHLHRGLARLRSSLEGTDR